MVVTKYMLLKKIAQVNQQSKLMKHTGSSQNSTLEEEGTVLLSTQKIIQVTGDLLITEQGLTAKLYSPIPGLYWKCLNTPDNKGLMTLNTPLEGLFLEDGTNAYCLGINGISDEFEIRMQVGSDEIRLNKLFLNINTSHLVINGIEEKRE